MSAIVNEELKKERIGKSRKMSCGSVATIIDYRSARDIDVQFNDGTIIRSTRYAKFLDGYINKISRLDLKSKRVGEKKIG